MYIPVCMYVMAYPVREMMSSSPAPCHSTLYSHHSLSRIRHTSPMSVNVIDNVNVTITPRDVSAESKSMRRAFPRNQSCL